MFRMVSALFISGLFFCAGAVSIFLEGYIPHRMDTILLRNEYRRISAAVGLGAEVNREPLVICFYRHSESRKTGIRLPEWGGGGAIGRDSIVIPVDRPSAFYRSDMERIILHEMVHIALARAWGPLRVPRWFHEGMAMTLSGELDSEEILLLSRAILTRSLVPLDSMRHLNRFNRFRARVAYSQCHFAVRFLLDTYGYDLVPELLGTTRETGRFERACYSVFGLTQKELETILRKEMVRRYRLLFLIGDYSLLWIGILILAILAFVITLIRNRRKRLMMESEERGEENEGD